MTRKWKKLTYQNIAFNHEHCLHDGKFHKILFTDIVIQHSNVLFIDNTTLFDEKYCVLKVNVSRFHYF